jgi:hypothetical protein
VYCVVSCNNSPASTVQIAPPPPLSSVFHFSLSMSPWHQEPCSFSKKFHSKFNIQINGNGNGRPCCSSCLEMEMEMKIGSHCCFTKKFQSKFNGSCCSSCLENGRVVEFAYIPALGHHISPLHPLSLSR